MRKLRIGILGAVGSNLGDEAVAVASVGLLRRAGLDAEFSITTAVPGAITRSYPDLEEFLLRRSSPWGWVRLVRWIYSLDVLLVGGGSLIQDKLGISRLRGMIPFLSQVLAIAKFARKPILTLPVGVDRLETELGRTMAGPVLRKFDYLQVRDPGSAKNAKEYGGGAVDPVLVCDPAFSLEETSDVFAAGPTTGMSLASPYIAISLVRENLPLERLLAAIQALIQEVLSEGYQVLLVPMDKRQNDELSLFQELQRGLPEQQHSRCTILTPDTPLQDVIRVLRGARFLVAMRLHAAILALGYTPVFMISRTTKTEQLIEGFGLASTGVEATDCVEKLAAWSKTQLHSAPGPFDELSRQRALRIEKSLLLDTAFAKLATRIQEGI